MTFVSTTRAANMSSGLLLDPLPSADSSTPNAGQRFRPYTTPNHHVTKGRYITSNDPRGYIPVYEYPLNGQWIMLDMDDGYVLWTGIWKALGNSKADIVKMVESQPDLASKLRRVRGGYLKIQGTWMPYEIALRLARRVAWPIRHELVPLFGPTFPSTCLSPDQPGYGQVVKPGTGRRRARRTYAPSNPQEAVHDWSVTSQPAQLHADVCAADPPFTYQPRRRQAQAGPVAGAEGLGSPVQLHMPYSLPPPASASSPASPVASSSRASTSHGQRYSPYPAASGSQPSRAHAEGFHAQRGAAAFQHDIRLPPLQSPDDFQAGRRRSVVALPPITAMVDRSCCDDSAAVLRRLQTPDGEDGADTHGPRDEESSHRRLPPMRLSFSAPSRASPSSTTAYGSPGTSSLGSPVSPALVTPVSGRSSLDGAYAAGLHSPHTPAHGGGLYCGAHDEHPRGACGQSAPSAAPAARAGPQDPDRTARSWRPW